MTDRREGFFLVFEGVEGAGKSTHVGRLAERLRAAGRPARVVREPGGTRVGERIRSLVLDPELAMSPEAELLLLLAARAEFVRSLVRPALERGELVLADRYELSTYAYQGIGRGLGLERVRKLNAFATGGLVPDGVVLLTVGPEEGLHRKGGSADRMERETEEFHRRVAAAYEELAGDATEVIVVDTTRATKDEVEARILRELRVRWPETFNLGGVYDMKVELGSDPGGVADRTEPGVSRRGSDGAPAGDADGPAHREGE